MNNGAFSNAKFNFAWEIPLNICLFNTIFNITASADAYYETDGVTTEQNDSFALFLNNRSSILASIETALLKESGSQEAAIERFTPKVLKIKRNGDFGIVFDDKNDFENGLVIAILPKFDLKMMSTDEYF